MSTTSQDIQWERAPRPAHHIPKFGVRASVWHHAKGGHYLGLAFSVDLTERLGWRAGVLLALRIGRLHGRPIIGIVEQAEPADGGRPLRATRGANGSTQIDFLLPDDMAGRAMPQEVSHKVDVRNTGLLEFDLRPLFPAKEAQHVGA